MGKMLLALSLSALASVAQAENAAPLQATPDGRPLALTFADEFHVFRQYGTPGGVWRTTFGDGTQRGLDRRTLPNNQELELYVDPLMMDAQGPLRLDPFHVDGSGLVIEARPTPADLVSRLGGFRYVSGLITSQPSFSQTYGYFEMRAKLPSGKGLWPAFWLLPADGSWPPEIDVMESVGDASKVYSTAHSNFRPAVEIDGQVSPDAFHTYAVSWDPSHLEWFVDGRKIGEEATPADLHKPMYMLANLAVGGDWPGSPDASTVFPAKMTIAFIRAYKFAS